MDKIVQDVIPPSVKSIRRIPVPRRPDRNGPIHDEREGRHTETQNDQPQSRTPRRQGTPSILLWVIVVAVVIGAVFAVSYAFSGATLTLIPKQQEASANLLITAKKNAISGDLQFDEIVLGKTASQEVAATGQEFVEEKAFGQ